MTVDHSADKSTKSCLYQLISFEIRNCSKNNKQWKILRMNEKNSKGNKSNKAPDSIEGMRQLFHIYHDIHSQRVEKRALLAPKGKRSNREKSLLEGFPAKKGLWEK